MFAVCPKAQLHIPLVCEEGQEGLSHWPASQTPLESVAKGEPRPLASSDSTREPHTQILTLPLLGRWPGGIQDRVSATLFLLGAHSPHFP